MTSVRITGMYTSLSHSRICRHSSNSLHAPICPAVTLSIVTSGDPIS